jgi:hypothetical protein
MENAQTLLDVARMAGVSKAAAEAQRGRIAFTAIVIRPVTVKKKEQQ